MRAHFNAVASERPVWSLTGNTMFPLSTAMQQLMTCSANIAIQTSSQSVPSTPSWFGEVVPVAHHLKCQSVLAAIEERVGFARRRFGHYDLID